jgi:Fur family ferric uptake transcriptional regulator
VATTRAHREKLATYLEAKGLRRTRQRDAIADLFLRTEDHLTSDELHQLVAKQHPSIGLATVYRTLKLFVEAGIASERTFRDGVSRYEVRQPHHDHLICTSCGEILEFENEEIERLQEQVARRRGFRLTAHRLELYGVCRACQERAAPARKRRGR